MVHKTKDKKRLLVLLDAHAILHRAYHALPDFSSPGGEPTGAIYGLSAMLMRIINELKPDYAVACYDMPGPTFRHEAYEAYKAKRPKAEDDLVHQMNRSRDVFKAFNIPIYEKEGFEADDLLGTIVETLQPELKKGIVRIIVASGDMDTLQLVTGDAVSVYTLKKGIHDTVIYDEDAVKDRFGFAPLLLPDFKGLRGDPSDNIIGVRGIGEKTATLLIQKFGSVEDIYKALKKNRAAFFKNGFTERIVRILEEGEEEALFSKTLATIRRDAPISFSLPAETWKESFRSALPQHLFSELGFRTLAERVKKMFGEGEGEVPESGEKKEALPSNEEIQKTALALWLVDSNRTDPGLSDILEFAGTSSFEKARDVIFAELKKRNLEKVYTGIELPLIPILASAQRRGIMVDTAYLSKLSVSYHADLLSLEKKIWKEAGEKFNVNSPKQLGRILFEVLGLEVKGLKKTGGGARSTRESELEKLRQKHPIIDSILKFRELQKLLSTYIDALPSLVAQDGRVHTTFVQTGTTTGRFSSKDPNVQNIPVRGGRGMEVRRAFVAAPGFRLLALDYSQIEFRILAILSKDKDLIRIFNDGVDVHTAVASRVFGVPESEVTKDMRRRAKVINFGIIFGMGVSSLQRTLGGTREEAQAFYDNYFNKFPGVAEYLRNIPREAARKGYTETLFGRRRYIHGLSSPIPYIKNAALRMAVNAPIQGTATGDIIKLAIVKADTTLREQGLHDSAFLLLQIHDELMYEVKEDALLSAARSIKGSMEHVFVDAVPLLVEVSEGKNWGELKKLL